MFHMYIRNKQQMILTQTGDFRRYLQVNRRLNEKCRIVRQDCWMSSDEGSRKSNVVFKKNARVACNCGWEVRFGYGVAVTLAIFEAKRFFMLILEIFAEWQIIRFAGGLRPVIFTLVNVSLGLPTALFTLRSIRS